ncbi:hypothetical protein EMGBS15_01960 [Filimonas sp.]|nr:hypothetical protein EMGBS15_01960 [Filimonas sp.]
MTVELACPLKTFYLYETHNETTMKKLLVLLTIALAHAPSFAQCSFTINQVATDVNCEYGNDGVITANPAGGLSPYTFSLNGSGPQATGSFNGLAEGNYTLYVSDASPCMDSVVITLTHIHAAPVLTDPPDQIVCTNTATTAVIFSSNIPGTSFSWTNTNPSIGLAPVSSGNPIPSFIAINNSTTPAVATITVTPIGPAPDFCVGLSQSFTITVLPDVNINLTSATGTNVQTVCSGNAISHIVYTLGGSATNATVSGLPLGVTSSFAGGSLTIAGFSGPYGIFTYTVTATGSCASATATGTIQSMPLSSSVFSYPESNLCQGSINIFPNNISTPGGTFSATPAGLVLSTLTGEIDLSASAVGYYAVKYITLALVSIQAHNM